MRESLPDRYSRQIPLPGLGQDGQKRLSKASVLVVGCGGLGSTLLFSLAGVGVGHIAFCDGDVVSPSNLNRQFLHTTADLGRNKATSAYSRLQALNPEIDLTPIPEYFTEQNGPALIGGRDLVLLAVDSIAHRLMINRMCIQAGIPLVNGGVEDRSGLINAVIPGRTACLSCLYGAASPTVPAVSALPTVVSAVSSLEAHLGLQLLLGQAEGFLGKLFLFDGVGMTLQAIPFPKRPGCPVCGG